MVFMLPTVKETLKDSFNLKSDLASPEEIKENILAGGKVKGTNMCILILAILIASIGLNMNSTAVIIGAMLISPLMGGIQTIGYGIAANDLATSKKAAVGLAFQVFICILTSTVYFSLTPILDVHSEILARTSPSIWDVLIAICGGFAGIIGITRKEKTNVIPGVAIATALMPPLCTAGFGLATRNLKFFAGAMYLFFINSFFICLTAIIILKIIKIPCKEIIDARAKKKLYIKIAVIAVITIIPSIVLAYQLITRTIVSHNIEKFIKKEINSADTQIVQMSEDEEEHILEIALLGRQLNRQDINRLEETLPEYGLEEFTLKITQPSMDGMVTADDLQKYLAKDQDDSTVALALKDAEIANLKEQIADSEEKLGEMEAYQFDLNGIRKDLRIFYPAVEKISIGRQKGCASDGSGAYQTVLVILNTKEKLSEEDHEKLTEWFREKTGEKSVTLIEEYPEPEETDVTETETLSEKEEEKMPDKTDKTEKKKKG